MAELNLTKFGKYPPFKRFDLYVNGVQTPKLSVHSLNYITSGAAPGDCITNIISSGSFEGLILVK